MAARVVGAVLVVSALIAVGVYAAVQIAGDGDGGRAADPLAGSPRDVPQVSAPGRRAPDETTTSAEPEEVVPIASIRVRATEIATLDKPVDLATRPGDETLYVAEQDGRLVAVRPGGGTETLLDMTDEVSHGSEQGLLGLEFTPDGAFLYANFTDVNGDTRIVEWVMGDDRPDPGSRRQVLAFGQPYDNHNGGALEFGPDGFLYVSTGDGGSAGDPEGNAQSLDTLLGKVLRIHPRPTDGAPYAVPSSNPFLGRDGVRGEIWAYGLRNPWRISFDRQTGDLWIGDVGQGTVEEVDFQPAGAPGGANYGWDRLEGSRPFEGDPPEEHALPIHEYTQDGGGCAVTGGYVYRGARVPALRGVYLFGDYCLGEVRGLREAGGEAVDVGSLGVQVESITSFGEDEDGEVYVLSRAGGVYRIEAA